jgi:hypothetical protein
MYEKKINKNKRNVKNKNMIGYYSDNQCIKSGFSEKD